ncbi:MAG: YcjX family protein [Rhodobiaceae bacterium]|nr:YcjX family protein [Rhodobiaceae bacterium]MCC0055760.1 YcjX family protein [Rhodobiaceae bacterium]
MAGIGDLFDDARLIAANIADYASDIVEPTLRLGVTGLARSGKTVFITALVNALLSGGRLPLFEPYASGRLARAHLEPQPDDAVPRFAYEEHLAALTSGNDRHWPESTRRIAELRIVIRYESASLFGRTLSGGQLTLDIVDYPGEWLLDLPLLGLDYAEWSARTVAMSREGPRAELAAPWHALLAGLDAAAPAIESDAREAAARFTAYLAAARDERHALSALPPGRFMMPGDLEGSPALTFAPLDIQPGQRAVSGSLHAMMARRYDAYREKIVKPFFRDHFARLDRQIVLVDALQALNAGPAAIADLETALAEILVAFRPGANSLLSRIFARRIDRILFAATKADHVASADHDRLQAILRRLTSRAIERAEFAGAEVEAAALAAVRATREGTVVKDNESLPCVIGIPEQGQRLGRKAFNGEKEIAIFPGDLPENPESLFQQVESLSEAVESNSHPAEPDIDGDYRYVRFRPPLVTPAQGGVYHLPHIRLDRALQFLIGDRLR